MQENVSPVKVFSSTEAVRVGWEIVKKNFWFLIGMYIVGMIVGSIPAYIEQTIAGQYYLKAIEEKASFYENRERSGFLDTSDNNYVSSETTGYAEARVREFARGFIEGLYQHPGINDLPSSLRLPVVLLRIISFFLQAFITMGYLKIYLTLVSGKKAEFGELFSCYRQIFSYVLANILFVLIVMIGFFLLIVPGIIFALRFGFFSYFVVEDELGPIAALQKSWDVTRGSTGNLFVFSLLLILINLFGLIALVVGLVFTIPTSMLAYTYVYRKLRRESFGPPAPELA